MYKKIGLTFVITIIIILTYQIWQYWPVILMKSFAWQRENNASLSKLLFSLKEQQDSAAFYLMWLSFLYGIIHSVGPGHGKVIVTTFLATNPGKFKQGLMVTFLAAFMQALVAIALVTCLLIVFDRSVHDLNMQIALLIKFSFIIIGCLGVFLIIKAIKNFIKNKEHASHEFSPTQLNKAVSIKSYLIIIISVGIRPCTGAIMVLVLARMLKIYHYGVISSLLMALGTAITTSTLAVLTISGKKIIKKYMDCSTSNFEKFSAGLQFVGGGLLVLFSLILLNSQQLYLPRAF